MVDADAVMDACQAMSDWLGTVRGADLAGHIPQTSSLSLVQPVQTLGPILGGDRPQININIAPRVLALQIKFGQVLRKVPWVAFANRQAVQGALEAYSGSSTSLISAYMEPYAKFILSWYRGMTVALLSKPESATDRPFSEQQLLQGMAAVWDSLAEVVVVLLTGIASGSLQHSCIAPVMLQDALEVSRLLLPSFLCCPAPALCNTRL
jgi:hypothetical protein